MAKGDDALSKKKNKAIRKRNRRAGAGTTEAIEGVQAHKRRRKAGTRRVCEAMCYTLPTPEDPFLDKRKRKEKLEFLAADASAKVVDGPPADRRSEKPMKKGRPGSTKGCKGGEGGNHSIDPTRVNNKEQVKLRNGTVKGSNLTPLKKVVWNANLKRVVPDLNGDNGDALSAADHAFQGAVSAIFEVRDSDGSSTEQQPQNIGEFERQWWHACAQGVGVLGAGSGTPCIRAYAVGAAPHVAVHRNLYGLAQGPIALVLVNTKEHALSVRQICKSLKKALNIHSVSLHSGTPVEHQVNGLAMQTPEIVVATPDRLCQLLSLSAIKLSSVSYVVVDGLDDIINGGFKEQTDIIRNQLQKGVQVGVLSRTFHTEVVTVAGNWLEHPIVRAVSDTSVPACSACIMQVVTVVTTEETKLLKINKILEQVRKSQENNQILGSVLLIVKGVEQFSAVKGLILKHNLIPHIISEAAPAPRELRQAVLIATYDDFIELSLLSTVVVTINYDFSWPILHYTKILTAMARTSSRGRVETLCSGAAALQANGLVDTLNACWQLVPKPLLLLAQAATLLHQ